MNKLLLPTLLAIVLLFSACKSDNHYTVDVSEIDIEGFEIQRFETRMFELTKEEFFAQIKDLAREFPVFLEGDLDDTLMLNRYWSFFEDRYAQELYHLAKQDYPNIDALSDEIEGVYKHMRYYYPAWEVPRTYTYVSSLDFQFPIKYSGYQMLIALDMYMKSGTEVYMQSGVPKYMLRKYQAERIAPDVAAELARTVLPPPPSSPRLLDKMVYEGKKLYFIHSLMPELHDSVLHNYSPMQMEWCERNEAKVWAFILESDFLFQSQLNIIKKFMDDGPFTSLFNKKSPARIGEYIGYKLVMTYAKENKLSLEEVVEETNAQKILNASGYHPE